MSRDIIYLVIGSSYGRMAQLVVPAGTNLRILNVDVDGMLASRSHRRLGTSSKFPDDL